MYQEKDGGDWMWCGGNTTPEIRWDSSCGWGGGWIIFNVRGFFLHWLRLIEIIQL